jgi:predicted NBD/HSP70 family sugar kinase
VKVREKSVNALLLDFATQTRYSIHTNDLPRYRDQQSSPAVVLDLVRQLVDASQSRGSPVAGLAITIEGPIENATGAIAPWAWHRLPQWKGLDIQQHFSRNTQLPLVIDNDANLAALAEWTWGEGRGCDDFLHITCAEGIGGGIVIDGRIYRGGNGLAGEIGHMVIEEAGELCFCGSRGCLSSFVTERAILASLRNTESPKGSLLEVIQSARQGDAACQRVLFEAGLHLGKALATVVRVISPRTIAIGGTLAAAGDILLEGLRSSAEVTNLRAMGKSPVFCLATVINDAPELGGISALMTQLGFGTSDLAPWMLAAAPPEPV